MSQHQQAPCIAFARFFTRVLKQHDGHSLATCGELVEVEHGAT